MEGGLRKKSSPARRGIGFAGRGNPECESVNPQTLRMEIRRSRRSPIPQRSGLIRVQNPSSYVTMSRKVPPQAVTSRRRGGIEGLGIWLQISRTQEAAERPRRMRTAQHRPMKVGTGRADGECGVTDGAERPPECRGKESLPKASKGRRREFLYGSC